MAELTIDTLLERARIESVLNRYACALDARDWSALGDVFTPDATAHFQGIGHYQGRDAIIAVIQSALSHCGSTQHLLGNVRIEVDGDRAQAKCYLQAVHAGLGEFAGATLIIWGEYRDRLVRLPEGWRIAHRELVAFHAQGDIGIKLVRPE